MSSSTSFRAKPQQKSQGNFKIARDAVVCLEAQLTGNVTIGSRTVVHPSARILAEGGPIIIGENNLIQELATIINRKPVEGEEEGFTMTIGNGNVFEVGSCVESPAIGDDNTFEPKSRTSRVTSVSDRCVIGAACSVESMETIPSDTIICGAESTRHRRKVPLQTSNQQQLMYLSKILPNYHRLIKSS